MRRHRLIPVCAAAGALLVLAACSRSGAQLRTFPMGEKVEMGHIIYTVFETQWLTQAGEGISARIPQNRFFVVRLSAANSSNAKLLVPNLTIVDDNGNEYHELTNGDGIPKWVGFLREVEPAEALQGVIAFDAPPRHYRLRVTDEDEQKAGYIDIPLTFSSESPEVPLPGAARPENSAPVASPGK